MNETEQKALKAVLTLAALKGISVEELMEDMQSAIDAAWNNPDGEEKRREMFPDGKPTVLQFMAKTYKEIT